MVSATVSSKLNFLDRAARYYALASPSTSAHLAVQRNNQAEREPLTVRSNVGSSSCQACGTLLMSGVTTRISVIGGASRSKAYTKRSEGRARKANNTDKLPKSIVWHCLICYRYTKKPIVPVVRVQKAVSLTKTRTIEAPSGDKETAGEPASRATKNASSKQRAKARQGGLQALLQKTRQDAKITESGLNLTDFMKKD